jgi:peptide chain release factor subunit 1
MAVATSLEALRTLAEFRAAKGCAISLYLDLDPQSTINPGDVQTHVHSLLDGGGRKAGFGSESLTRDQTYGLKSDVERIKQYFAADFDRGGMRAFALFASGLDNLWKTLALPCPVNDDIRLGRELYLAPLLNVVGQGEGALVAVVSRERGEVYRLSAGRLHEVANETEDVPNQHDQGGWSQARYQRSVDKEAYDHLKNTNDELLRMHKRRAFDALFVAAPEAVFADFRERLHPYLAERLTGRIDVDVENTGPDDVQRAAGEAIAAYERKLEEETLDRLIAATNSNGRGVTGLDGTLEALNEQRVEVLLLQENFDAAGVGCPQCGWLGPHGVTTCPVDGTPTLERDDITDLAVRRALRQSARVVLVRDDERLEPLGSIAALLRF